MFDCTNRVATKTIPINYLTNDGDRRTADIELQRKDPTHEARAYYKEHSASLVAGAAACDAAAAVMCWPLAPCFLASIVTNLSAHNGFARHAVRQDLHMAALDKVLVDVDKNNRFVTGSVQIPDQGRVGTFYDNSTPNIRPTSTSPNNNSNNINPNYGAPNTDIPLKDMRSQ